MPITLSIHQQLGQVGIKMNPCRFDLKQTPSDFSIERKAPEINIAISQGQVSIDITQMQNSLGYGGIEFITQSAAAEARQIFEMELLQSVQGGDALAQLHRHMSIGQLAAQGKFFDNNLPEVGLEYIAPPEIHYESGMVDNECQLGEVKIKTNRGKVEIINFEPAVIGTYLEKVPSIDITTKGWAFDFEA